MGPFSIPFDLSTGFIDDTNETEVMVYSKEQLNFFRVCHITVDILPHGLRTVFKQEWDRNYGSTFGEWQDTEQNGLDFYNNESKAKRIRNTRLLGTMQNGDTNDWDCTRLFYGILKSDSVGNCVSPTVRNNVDDLREFRNDLFAHKVKGTFTDGEFDALVSRALNAFSALGLSTDEISAVSKEKEFTTEEVNALKTELGVQRGYSLFLFSLVALIFCLVAAVAVPSFFKQESFYILPPTPSHTVIHRASEVESIMDSMRELSRVSNGTISALYISGNPGSGKSEVARQVAEIFESQFKKVTAVTFVATFNAETVETLINSYNKFLLALGCPEEVVTGISSSGDLSPTEKLAHLKALAFPRVQRFSPWLLVVDNVVDLASVRDFLPQHGTKEWGQGQLLITTQDSDGIPANSTHTSRISLSDGMREEDCVALLTKVSTLFTREGTQEVCRALDRQPLALACAAVYVRYVIDSGASNFTWFMYLEKLEKGQRESTEEVFEKSENYKKSMTTAVRLAVERAVDSDIILRHAFQFMSFFAAEPLPLSTVVKYVMSQVHDLDEHLVAAKLTTSSLTICVHCEVGGPERDLRVHRVLFDVNRKFFSLGLHGSMSHLEAALGAVHSALPTEPLPAWKTIDYVKARNLLPHLEALLKHINSTLLKLGSMRNKSSFTNSSELTQWLLDSCRACYAVHSITSAKLFVELCLNLVEHTQDEELKASVFIAMGTVCKALGQLETSKEYYEKALAIREKLHSGGHLDVAASLHNLGMVSQKLGNIYEAKDYHERSLAMKIKIFNGSDHYRVANSLNQLGVVYAELNETELALKYCHKALEIRNKVYGTDHPLVSFSLVNLGNINVRDGQLEKAEQCYNKALAIREKVYGKYDYRVAECLYVLGNVYERLGKVTIATEYHERSLEIRQKVFNKEHPDVVESVAKLRHLHEKQRAV